MNGWNEGDASAIESMMSEDCVIEGLEFPPGNKKGYIDFHAAIHKIFDHLHIEVLTILENEYVPTGYGRVVAVHKLSGKELALNFSFWSLWKNGRMIKGSHILDYLTMLKDNGFIEGDLLKKALRSPPRF